jgi:hypothetical protein
MFGLGTGHVRYIMFALIWGIYDKMFGPVTGYIRYILPENRACKIINFVCI